MDAARGTGDSFSPGGDLDDDGAETDRGDALASTISSSVLEDADGDADDGVTEGDATLALAFFW